MNDYLGILAERSLGSEPAIRPRREGSVRASATTDLELQAEVPAALPGPARPAPRPSAQKTAHPQSALLRAAARSTEAGTAPEGEGGERGDPGPPRAVTATDPRPPADVRAAGGARPAQASHVPQPVTVEAPARAGGAMRRRRREDAAPQSSDRAVRSRLEPRPATGVRPAPGPAGREPAEAAAPAQPAEGAAASSEPAPPSAGPVARRREAGEPPAARAGVRRSGPAELEAAPARTPTQAAQPPSGENARRGAQPPVRVTIGRIDVVASRPDPVPGPRRRAPATSLDDYLQARWGERR
jgi:hypothetical protein